MVSRATGRLHGTGGQYRPMNENTATAPAASAAPGPVQGAWPRIRACLPELGRHGRKVGMFCVVIGLVLWMARSDQRLDMQLVYSFATGMTSWLLIDLGRFWVDPDSPIGFPRGWRGAAMAWASSRPVSPVAAGAGGPSWP